MNACFEAEDAEADATRLKGRLRDAPAADVMLVYRSHPRCMREGDEHRAAADRHFNGADACILILFSLSLTRPVDSRLPMSCHFMIVLLCILCLGWHDACGHHLSYLFLCVHCWLATPTEAERKAERESHKKGGRGKARQ